MYFNVCWGKFVSELSQFSSNGCLQIVAVLKTELKTA